MKRIGKMLRKEYEAADSLAEVIRGAAAEREHFLRPATAGGEQVRTVDFKCVGDAVKALKAVEELKRSITCTPSGGEAAAGIIELGRRDG